MEESKTQPITNPFHHGPPWNTGTHLVYDIFKVGHTVDPLALVPPCQLHFKIHMA